MGGQTAHFDGGGAGPVIPKILPPDLVKLVLLVDVGQEAGNLHDVTERPATGL